MKEEDYDLIDDESRNFLLEPMKSSWSILVVIVTFVTVMILWAALTSIDERTQATGKVIPSSQVKQIQNLEGGIISEILVKEGQEVKEGQVLLKLDETRFASEYKEKLSNQYSLMAELARLQAESEGKDSIDFPEIIKNNYPDIVKNQTNLFNSNRSSHDLSMKTLKKAYEISSEQFEMAKPLAEEGVISKIEFLRIQKETNEAKGKLDVEVEVYQSKVRDRLVKVKSEMDALQETLKGLKDKMARTTITSPVLGVVKKINIDTLGGVIEPGDVIMEVVPLNDVLLVEAKVRPEDIAFIRVGQPSEVKVSAYDSAIYGSLTGEVVYISPDAIMEKNERGVEESFFRVNIQTKTNYLEYRGEKLPIISGMQVTADILTGKKSVLVYLLKPIFRAKERAFQER